jgi:hypothetical protein
VKSRGRFFDKLSADFGKTFSSFKFLKFRMVFKFHPTPARQPERFLRRRYTGLYRTQGLAFAMASTSASLGQETGKGAAAKSQGLVSWKPSAITVP